MKFIPVQYDSSLDPDNMDQFSAKNYKVLENWEKVSLDNNAIDRECPLGDKSFNEKSMFEWDNEKLEYANSSEAKKRRRRRLAFAIIVHCSITNLLLYHYLA